MTDDAALDAEKTADEVEHDLLEQEKATVRRRKRAKQEVDAEEKPSRPIEFLTEDEFMQQPAADFLVDGLIVDGSLWEMVGPPGTLKTFLTIDLCGRIAAGHPSWLGRPVRRHGPVVYILGEGRGRFKHRLQLWKQVNKVTGPLPFFIVPHPLDMRDPNQVQQLLDRVASHTPVQVIFDTRSRNLPGAEENSAKDMGQAIAAANRIQQLTGATVGTLHHPTKDESSSRGSGAWKGAVDLELWVRKAGDAIYELSVSKAKDSDDELKISFVKRVVELNGIVDAYGQPVTSVVVEVASQQQIAKAKVNLQKAVLAYVKANPMSTTTLIRDGVPGGNSKVKDVLEVLEKRKSLICHVKGKSKKWEITSIGEMELNPPF